MSEPAAVGGTAVEGIRKRREGRTMATRSGIGVEREDGSVVAVYCRCDGFPQGVRAMLQDDYLDRSKVEELFSAPRISSVSQEIEGGRPFTFSDRETFRDELRRTGVDCLYILASGGWLVSKPSRRWRYLEDVLSGGVELLVEPNPDRGADILVERDSEPPLVFLLSCTGPGRDWLEDRVDPDAIVLGGRVSAETRFAIAIVERARRDGLVVEEDRS
jgi:hypothetical protein